MKQIWAQDKSQLNEFELFKLEKDGLDIIKDLEHFKEVGFENIPEQDKNLLKWAGVYIQRPKTDGFFMMRVKVPSGILNSTQARVIANIAKTYGRDILDLTTRQAIQFHWLTIDAIPNILKSLHEVNMDTIEACGDCPRTIVGNPLVGIDPDETIDTSEIISESYKYFQNNREFSNLPRKFKISISANIYNAGHAEINDLAFTPASKTIDGKEIKGFHVYVGGGLSTKPLLAEKLDLFVRPEEVLRVAKGVVTIFRDYGYRKSRGHARLKFLVQDWGKEKFLSELIKQTGISETSGTDLIKSWNAGYFYGVHPQKQPDMNYLGLAIPQGRLSSSELLELATLADKYGDGSLRTCNSKTVLLTNVHKDKVVALLQEPLLEKLSPYPKNFTGYTVTCTGKEFCNFALVETKTRAKTIANILQDSIQLENPIRIHMTGCPHSCGQLQIADIGLRGLFGRINGHKTDCFEISLGGTLDKSPRFAIPLKGNVPAESIHIVLIQILCFYKAKRTVNESFADFVLRNGSKPLQQIVDDYLNTFNKEDVVAR